MNSDGSSASHIDAVSLKTGERRKLVQGADYARFVPPGYLVYQQGSSLMATRFDPIRLKVVGNASRVVGSITPGQYNIGESGALAYVPGSAEEKFASTLVRLDRKGAQEAVGAPPRIYKEMDLSPDGKRIAVTIGADGEDGVWIYDLPRETLTRLTYEGAYNILWTPDGKRISYGQRKDGLRRFFLKNADGSGAAEEFLKGEVTLSSWSPDGEHVIQSDQDPASRSTDLWVYSMKDKKRQPFLQTPFNEAYASFSPDGRWIAYESEESGQSEVYVQAFTGPGGKWQVSKDGGCCAVWARSGKELFYVYDNRRVMVVDVQTSPEFKAGKPRLLFARDLFYYDHYDVLPDGRAFIMVERKKKEALALPQINLVLNWAEELKRTMPLEKR